MNVPDNTRPIHSILSVLSSVDQTRQGLSKSEFSASLHLIRFCGIPFISSYPYWLLLNLILMRLIQLLDWARDQIRQGMDGWMEKAHSTASDSFILFPKSNRPRSIIFIIFSSINHLILIPFSSQTLKTDPTPQWQQLIWQINLLRLLV